MEDADGADAAVVAVGAEQIAPQAMHLFRLEKRRRVIPKFKEMTATILHCNLGQVLSSTARSVRSRPVLPATAKGTTLDATATASGAMVNDAILSAHSVFLADSSPHATSTA